MLARQACSRRFLGTLNQVTTQSYIRGYSRAVVAKTGRNTGPWSEIYPHNPRSRSSYDDDPRARSLLNKQLYHFDEPFHMAKHVESELNHGRFEQALTFTRKTSASAKVTVSWNHLIRHALGEQKARTALKLYNEMKKRGQQPNAQTYTIIFSGLARSEHPGLAVSEAIKLYQSMLANDKLPPNEIHLNAVLNVCARGRDMDSLFSVLELASERGQSPSHVTYTTILHALRASIEAEAIQNRKMQLTEEQIKENKNQILQRCKTIWDEIIRRWKAGKVMLDEELVCVMGRILMQEDDFDVKAILDLVSEAMRLPAIPPEGSKKNTKSQKPVFVAKSPGKGVFVRPGNNTLSMILQALAIKHLSNTAMEYWQMLTVNCHITPDPNNWHWLMTTIKRSHSSSRAANVVEIMPRSFLNYTTFRMAIAACYRDNKNPHMYDHADKVAQAMFKVLDMPDPETTREYLSIITLRLNHVRATCTGKNSGPFNPVLAALDTVYDPICKALSSLEYKGVDHNALKAISGDAYNQTAEYMSIARRVVALYDRILQSVFFPRAVCEVMQKKRRELIRYISTFYLPTDASEEASLGQRDERDKRTQANIKSKVRGQPERPTTWNRVNRSSRLDRNGGSKHFYGE